MNEKYIQKAITKALTMPPLPNGRPFAVEHGDSMTVYADNYCCWAIPKRAYTLSHPDELELHGMISRLALGGNLHEVKDTGRREIREGKRGSKKSVIAVLACAEFEIFVNEAMLKLFAQLNCRYWAKSNDTLLIVEDCDAHDNAYGIGGIMPVKPMKGE